jgi:NAD(P)-dependent dehydrogenase (short-subunit alcohol dehydrogenase family)
MAKSERVVVVTGANRGIGREIARQLSQKEGLRVIGTARTDEKAREARESLATEGATVEFLVLDAADGKSVRKFAQKLEKDFDRLDILINNAGVYIDNNASPLEVNMVTVRETMETNAFGPLRMIQALAPLMKRSGESGRIINVSSQMGQLSTMGGGYLAYRTSKTALNAITRVMAEELKNSKIAVYAMCPGWVKTDMGGANAPRTVEQGADTAVWLALEAPAEDTGLFFQDRKKMDW